MVDIAGNTFLLQTVETVDGSTCDCNVFKLTIIIAAMHGYNQYKGSSEEKKNSIGE